MKYKDSMVKVSKLWLANAFIKYNHDNGMYVLRCTTLISSVVGIKSKPSSALLNGLMITLVRDKMKTILYWLKYAIIPITFWAIVIICVIW